jgi:glycosyltransferase involved in cell wall biosynthesis
MMGADIVVMVHPDYQYSPNLIVPMAGMIAYGEYDAVIGSRILGKGALEGGMPLYKYISNRALTLFQNLMMSYKLSEYHTGFRAFSADVLRSLPLDANSDDFVFDNEMLAQVIHFGFRLGEISTPTRYFEEASSINFPRSVKYGLGVLGTSLRFRLNRMKLRRSRLFKHDERKLLGDYYHRVESEPPNRYMTEILRPRMRVPTASLRWSPRYLCSCSRSITRRSALTSLPSTTTFTSTKIPRCLAA